MATGKRYYWMKLKESFMTSDTIDYFMGLPDGANYVVLYQMLCLKTINTGGRFERQIGEIVIPYDVEKIRRDTKWFTTDTIRVALNLYRQFGLIYEDVNGVLVITNHDNLVGSETDSAQRMQNMRTRRRNELISSQCDGKSDENVTTENRDKREEIRDKSSDTREQISENSFNNNCNNNNPADDDAESAVDEFARRSGATVDAFLSVTPRLREQTKRVTKRIFAKAGGRAPTELDESKVYSYTRDTAADCLNNDRIYILTCAFYKASERGQAGNWFYIEAILGDMQNRNITTKDEAMDYFYARKGETV